MILDKNLELSDAQSLTTCSTAGSNTISDNVVDFGALTDVNGNTAYRAVGAGEELHVNVMINTAFSNTGNQVIQVALMTDSDATVSDGTTVLEGKAVALSTLSAGDYILRGTIPFEAYERYMGLNYHLSADKTNAGAGLVDAWISLDSESSYVVNQRQEV